MIQTKPFRINGYIVATGKMAEGFIRLSHSLRKLSNQVCELSAQFKKELDRQKSAKADMKRRREFDPRKFR